MLIRWLDSAYPQTDLVISRVAGAALFGWSGSGSFGPAAAAAPAPTLLYSKYFIFTGP